ncbi:uncharacterized protein [Diadema antillarum]|uniref:uncharacterized protein n=1 Tax=Diadema antillarum TaxID=105358 RepID=UPI003A86FF0A
MYFLRHQIPDTSDCRQRRVMAAGGIEDAAERDVDVFFPEEADNITLQIRDFGCHLMWRELKGLDRLVLSKFKDVLASETWNYNDRPTYFTAVRNLQGFIEYELGNEVQAEEYFLEVLGYDHENICALGNVVHLLQKQNSWREAHTYTERLRAIFARSGKRDGNYETYPHRALAYADKAHAIRYFEQDKRCFRYMTYVERAATLGRYCRNSPQRAEWFFDHALALYRRDVQMLYLRKISDTVSDVLQTKIKSGYMKAIKLFYDVIQISSSSAYLSLSWVFIGILLNHDPDNRSLERIFPDSPELATMNADDCYIKGLSIDDKYEITTRRVGAEYVKLKRYREAKTLLDSSISRLGSWFAHRYRGVLYLSLYEDNAVTDEEIRSQFDVTPRTELLNMAKKEFETAQGERIVHADYSDLGQVYYLLKNIRQAKAKFKKALDSEQDDYFDLLETYRRWIRCVSEESPEDVAILQRKAEEYRLRLVATPLDTHGDSFSDDFDHYNRDAIPGYVRLLKEDDFWLASTTGCSQHVNSRPPRIEPIPQGQYKYDFFLSYHERDQIWSLALLNKLEAECNLRGCIEQRDFDVGEDTMVTIKRCLRESYRFIVVLSPHFVDGRDARSIMREAARVAFRRDGRYILPIELSLCEHEKLDMDDINRIECRYGQIPEIHWQNLVDSVRQPDHGQ